MAITKYILLTVTFKEDIDGRWVATCKETGTSTFAKSLNQVEKEIKEMITLHLNTLEKLGIREEFFKENNIKIYDGHKKYSRNYNLPINPQKITQSFYQPICV